MPTHVGRALAELGIGSIAAGSPQAKGRAERAGAPRRTGSSRAAARGRGSTAGAPSRCWPTCCPATTRPSVWRRPIRCRPGARCPTRSTSTRSVPSATSASSPTTPPSASARSVISPAQRGGRSLAGKRVEVRLQLDGRLVVADGSRVLLRAETDIDPGRLRDLEKVRFSLGRAVSIRRTAPGYPPRQDHPWGRVTPGSKLEATIRAERGLTDSQSS